MFKIAFWEAVLGVMDRLVLTSVGSGVVTRGYCAGLVTSAAGLPSLTYSRTIRDDQNQL